ncbi:non-ribosomal peptide synthetase [Nodularia spumigena]|uniref:non-ribosomal peptide synthetase n=1 Tax=Nodularia spumigena TaxID=70799 RepID=UPI00232B6590|nr:non-ribosomal peptide synthetase [Nodularia spumigena]MDB9319490.1 amino acid adenylation domain-containing protein [Nodularia spumigena CS-590/01A]MDB9325679.1 amino acid adenylation domain-containing protein [Nodularia spumigena CS-590/02]MDB9336641.1 amino acid adenylation domain-containing protein [Nodularia spumigena CS-590/01]MDB9362082.1 amino acid adenylation domain-containing protein [Nodularia spumigena CS-588/02]MDB9366393.1 amino acid adenylation domain-containing protein [Nodul
MVINSNSSLENLQVLTEQDKHQILVEWNNTTVDYPQHLCIHELFVAQVEKTPDNIAAVFNGQKLTYQELNHQANKVAHYLQSLGVGTEVLVGISVERSLEMIVGLLGILKAGAAYLPLDPSYPQERISFMLSDSQVQVLLTQQKFVESFAESGVKTVCLDQDWELSDRQNSENPTSNVTAENLAYVIYTSGSTGTPKGVGVPHRAVNRLVCNTNYVQFTTTDRTAQASNTSFDAATFEIWGSLLHGATLVGVPQNVLLSPVDFAAYIQEQKINILFLTTALFNQLANIVPQAFKDLRYLLFGGEAVDPKTVRAVLKNGAPQNLLHVYGPTESTTYSCFYPVKDVPEGATTLPIGRPISNTQIYILNEQLQPVPVGTPGEIYIGGDGLARGYLNRPELTAERFISHPFHNPKSKIQNPKLYKTGDLARYLPDGNIEFVGRVDNQVKIRGFRIELGEVEAALSQHPDIQQAVVIVREDVPGDKRLVAYVVSEQKSPVTATTLKSFLEDKLPAYMIPAAWMVLDSLPLTPNGKVDRRILPAPARTRPDLEEAFVAPRNSIEEQLATLWTELLGLDVVGVNDNFFCLGGHSLIVTQMISRAREIFSVNISFAQVFANPTIAAVAQLIAQGGEEIQWERPTIQHIAHEGLVPVSFSQERIYFVHKLAPENSAYQFQATMDIRGKLDFEALKRSLDEIVRRHEIFRTTYQEVNGRLYQVIHPHPGAAFRVVDLRDIPEPERQIEAQKLVEAELLTHLDLTQLPIVQWAVFQLSDQDYILTHVEHHMAHDGWSFNVFLSELVALYEAFWAGKPSPLPELSYQFTDFATWQREWAKTQEAQAQLVYWQQKLAGIPPLLELPYDRPRPKEQTYNGEHARRELPVDLCESLRDFSHQQGATLFMTMLEAFIIQLHRYISQDDIFIGSAVANRRMHQIEKIMGMVVNNLVLRTDVSANPTVRELLDRVRQMTMEAYANEDVPFDKVVEAVKPVRNLSHNPLFQVMFSFHNSAKPYLKFPGFDFTLHEPASNKSAKFDLDFLVIPRFEQSVQYGAKTAARGITLDLEYNSDLFDAFSMEAMLEQYEQVLIEMIANPDQRIGQIPLVTASQQKLLGEWNQTNRETTQSQCIHKLFELQVELTPDAVAVEQDGQKLTYRELSDRANKIAHYLQSLGVKPETLVGICVDRSLEMIAGLLGILKAGGAYVPIDPAYPQERIAEIIADTQLGILLTQNRYFGERSRTVQEKLVGYSGQTICLDTDWAKIATQSTANPVSDVQLNNLAYIIYTSGSTGKPKGVMIEHRSMLNFVTTAIDEYSINAQDHVLQFASVCFDTSIEEIFPCLAVGATLVLRTEEMLNSSDDFWRCCQKWQLTVLDLPTAYWHQLVTELNPQDSRIPGSLRTVIIGGEEVQLEKVQHWHHCTAHISPAPQLFNSYGPTEATVVTTLERLNPTNTSVSIGKPISNAQVYILDQYQQPVPIGVPGELHIGGAGLARGYWQRPELTAEKFIENTEGNRLYKTGDLVRLRRDGNLEYLGRVDNQVKIRGFRIELGEIETVLRQHPQISQAVVIAHQEITGQKRLVAYFVPQAPQPTIDELRQFLKQKLPNYMIPAAFMVLDSIPMTPNQKVDYRALPTPDFSRSDEDKFAAPRTLIEEKLVAIWSEVLRIENVGIHDNYFELGGDSILSIQLVSKASQAGIQIAAKQLFRYQTIAELATVAGMTRQINAEQGLVTGKVGLTPIQKWFFEQKLPEINYFNQSALLEVPADLQPELLQEVVQKLLVHHDALRTACSSVSLSQFLQESENWQQIHTDVKETLPLSIFDLSHLSSAEQETAIKTKDTELQASLDLATGEIAKVALFQLGKDQPSCLLFVIHHLAVDGVSWRILLEDLATAYQQMSRGQAIKLPEKTTSWKYWSDRLTEYAQTQAVKELDYWVNQSNISNKPLPVDYYFDSAQYKPGAEENNTLASTASVSLSLNKEQTRALLQDVPAAYNTQINDVLLTALVQSFAQWTKENSLLIDLEGHGREDLFEDVDLSRTVGWFTTLFPVGLEIKENQPGEVLKSVKEQLRSIPNRGIGYGVLRYLNADKSIREKLASLPSAQVSFNYLGQFDQVLKASSVLGEAKEFKSEQSGLNRRSHLLGISGFIRAGKLEMTWAYSDKIHKRDTIERLASGFMEALTTLIDHCQSKDDQSYTPSDFSAAKLNQKQLDKFLSKISKKK